MDGPVSSLPAPAMPMRIGQVVRSAIDLGHLPFAVVLYLMAVVLPMGFNLGPINLNGVRLLLLILILPMSFKLLAGGYGRLLLTDVCFFLHALWFTLALAVNNPSQVVANAGSTGIEIIGGYVLGRAMIRTRADFIALIRTLSTICLCLFPFVLYETATGKAVILRALDALPGLSSLKDIEIGKRLGVFRAQTVFSHPIHSGLFFIMTFSLCFIGLKGVYSEARRWLIGFVCATSCFLALSSGALLALVLQLGLIIWALIFRKVKARWWLLLALFAVAYVVIDLLSNRTPMMVFLSYATFSAHTAYWRTLIFQYGMDNILANPLFGIGLNDWVRPSWMRSGSVDNFWLLTAMRYGIPGFLFLAVGYAWALIKIGRRNFEADRALWTLRRAWMFSFMGLTFTLTTVHIWHAIFSFVFFMFGAGMWMQTAQPETGETRKAPSAAEDRRAGPRYTRFTEKRMRRG